MKISTLYFLPLLIIVISFSGCSDDEDSSSISNFEPTSGDYRTLVTLNGSNFSTEPSQTRVFMGALSAEVKSVSSNQITFEVPPGSSSGKIKVESKGEVLSQDDFIVTSGKWTNKAALERISLSFFSPYFVINEKLYVHHARSTVNGSPVDASFWEINTATNSMTKKKEQSKSFNSSGFVAWSSGSKGYFFRGFEFLEYDPTSDSWANLTVPATWPASQNAMIAFSIGGKGYVIASDKSFWIYDHSTSVWSRSLTNAPATFFGAECASYQNKAFVVSDDEFWIFDASLNSWTQKQKYPSYQSNFCFILNGELYVGNSYLESNILDDGFWKYDEVNNKWIQKASLKSPRAFPFYFSVNNKGYIGYGTRVPGDFYLNDIIEYQP